MRELEMALVDMEVDTESDGDDLSLGMMDAGDLWDAVASDEMSAALASLHSGVDAVLGSSPIGRDFFDRIHSSTDAPHGLGVV